jgi:thiazole synthase
MRKQDFLQIADRKFNSRLIMGTGKFPSKEIMHDAILASSTEIVTVALRRVNLALPSDNLLAFLDPQKYLILPNTSGCKNAKEAIRLAKLSLELGIGNWIKLEVTPDARYLLPDGEETLIAAKALVEEGFVVLPYINADPILAKKLQDIGTATVMPLGAPIGSNLGLQTLAAIKIIVEQATVPVIIDAGIGNPADASLALSLGADAIMLNTAVACALDPVLMAEAFKHATLAGRYGYLAGIASQSHIASASSPTD